MSTKDAIDIALKYGDVYTKIANFFILISLGIAGWVVSTEITTKTPILDFQRVAWALLYLGSSFMLWLGLINVSNRARASLGLARKMAADEGLPSNEIAVIAGDGHPWITRYLMPAAVLLIVLVMLFRTSAGFG